MAGRVRLCADPVGGRLLNTVYRNARRKCYAGGIVHFPLDGFFFFPYSSLMAFADFPDKEGALQIFRRSLLQDRLAHAYLISGGDIAALDKFAILLAKVLNCEAPPRRAPSGVGLDFCGQCRICRQIDALQQADVSWVRPESKSRIITIDQVRAVMDTVHLKAYALPFKVIIVSGADRMNIQASNAFLKTLEEPPARSILLLLSAEPQRLLDTIVSRCLRIRLSETAAAASDAAGQDWLTRLCEKSGNAKNGVGARYQILGDLVDCLSLKKKEIEKKLAADSPLAVFDDLEPDLRKRFEKELAAAIEAEYRRQRADLVSILQWFLRDVWLHTLCAAVPLLRFPELAQESQRIADRISAEAALKNIAIVDALQQTLNTNVQEALALEVALLKISL